MTDADGNEKSTMRCGPWDERGEMWESEELGGRIGDKGKIWLKFHLTKLCLYKE
jgi:hypothetical protein